MAQYCRYCCWFHCVNGNFCDKKGTFPTDTQAKRVNKCREFDLNPIDAFCENEKGYTPREKKEKQYDGQISLLV